MELNFSTEAQKVIDLYIDTKENIFVTGKAGTGKSTLLHHLRKITKKTPVVVAPTGVAAINVKGQTIHSFFKLKPGFELDEAKNMSLKRLNMALYTKLETVFIDEISMVRADLLDAIDVFLRRVRGKKEPFGGVRMIFFGDLFQLPPVMTDNDRYRFENVYESPFFFSAKVFNPTNLFIDSFQLKTIQLETIYRQKENDFVDVLNAIRENKVTQKQLDFLNEKVDPNAVSTKENKMIHLVTTNRRANMINTVKLDQIKSEDIEFKAHKRGEVEKLQPNDDIVTVKIGAQVMFINNDQDGKWVNGSIGEIIEHFKDTDPESGEYIDGLRVKLDTGKTVFVTPYTWDISRYNFKANKFVREEIGSFTQIPLKLAWAITIHKSQGKTFNHVAIDLERGSFAHGQTYVALSRCTSMEGLILKRPIQKSDIILDPKVLEFL
jgi:ATP-dependent exoDNAse (exonuclease V) alpha subunit